jgi:hypothetical protein
MVAFIGCLEQQGIEIRVNPQTHWWCLWLCTTTDNADMIECTIKLESAIVPGVTAKKSCTNCGDLTIKSDGSAGFSAPWEFQSVEFKGRYHSATPAAVRNQPIPLVHRLCGTDQSSGI